MTKNKPILSLFATTLCLVGLVGCAGNRNNRPSTYVLGQNPPLNTPGNPNDGRVVVPGENSQGVSLFDINVQQNVDSTDILGTWAWSKTAVESGVKFEVRFKITEDKLTYARRCTFPDGKVLVASASAQVRHETGYYVVLDSDQELVKPDANHFCVSYVDPASVEYDFTETGVDVYLEEAPSTSSSYFKVADHRSEPNLDRRQANGERPRSPEGAFPPSQN